MEKYETPVMEIDLFDEAELKTYTGTGDALDPESFQ